MTDEERAFLVKESQVGQRIMAQIEDGLDQMEAPLGFRLGLFSSLVFGVFIDQSSEEDHAVAVHNIDKLIGVLQAMREAPDAAGMQAVLDASAAVNLGAKPS